MNFNDRVYDIVRRVPKGKVISYGQVAFLAGSPRGARAVGWALHRNPYPWVTGGERRFPAIVWSTGRAAWRRSLHLAALRNSAGCWREKA